MNAKENPMQKIIAKCWEDDAFKKELMANPNAVLKAEGVTVPDGITVNVVEDTEQVRSLVIPLKPQVMVTDGSLASLNRRNRQRELDLP